ncbi:hypothetical protein GCM10010300_55130 [Streptomyces olivaceoviridis]|nr:hypothetical protein GCM10010300_55130 [Streptomyces olivaceoviridis]
MEPGDRSLDHPPVGAQAGSVRSSASGDHGHDASGIFGTYATATPDGTLHVGTNT